MHDMKPFHLKKNSFCMEYDMIFCMSLHVHLVGE